MHLSPRARVTYVIHLYKALTHQDHTWLVPTLTPLIGANGIVIDVGGHAGQFTKLFSKIAPRGHVHAFEPGSYARSILARVIQLKGLANVTLYPMALGDSPKSLTFNIPVKQSGSIGFGLSHLGEKKEGRAYQTEEVEQTTLDAFVADAGLARVDFIKADIEGWEGRMLAGAQEILRRFRPTLYLELNDAHLARANDTVSGIWDMLTDLGYEGWALNKDRMCLERTQRGAALDVFFIHPGRAQPNRSA